MLSQIERGLSSPSIRSLQKLAEIFSVPVGWFFSEATAPQQGPAWIQRRAQRRVLDLSAKGITKELLNPEGDGVLELMLITVEPGGSSGERPTSIPAKMPAPCWKACWNWRWMACRAAIQAGDSFRFPATQPHRFSNPGPMRCVVVWAVTPPLY
jgi:transcriptional regulator with XRE-family HTH domain